MKNIATLLFMALAFSACEDPAFTPKPRAYPKVNYPEKSYQPFAENYCGFTFEYPKYAMIQQDTSFFDKKPAHPCWFNVEVPAFDCRIHCSYAPVSKANPIDRLKNDAFRMTDWHNKKATYIDEKPFRIPGKDVKGILFKVEGPAASQLQFFITDTLEQRHFFRGALYFNTQARPDSLAPVIEFMEKDVARMIESFRWR